MTLIILPLWFMGALILTTVVAILAKRIGAWAIYLIISGLSTFANLFAASRIDLKDTDLLIPGGLIAFVLIFYLKNVLIEEYGNYEARKGILVGVISQLVFIPFFWMYYSWTLPEFLDMYQIRVVQDGFGFSPKTFLSFLVSYILVSFLNQYIFSYQKYLMKGRALWLRNFISLFISIMLMTILFAFLADVDKRFPYKQNWEAYSLILIIGVVLTIISFYFVKSGIRKIMNFNHEKYYVSFSYIKNKLHNLNLENIDKVLVFENICLPISVFASSFFKKESFFIQAENISNSVPESCLSLNREKFDSNNTILLITKFAITLENQSLIEHILNVKIINLYLFGDKETSLFFQEKNLIYPWDLEL